MVITATGITIFGVFISFRLIIPGAVQLWKENLGPWVKEKFSDLSDWLSEVRDKREKRIAHERNAELKKVAMASESQLGQEK